MSDAEATIRQMILSGIINNSPINDNKVKKIVDDVFTIITNSAVIWALDEVVIEHSKNTQLYGK
jgi:hypothetical protein